MFIFKRRGVSSMSMLKRCVAGLFVLCALTFGWASVASASVAPAPGWEVFGRFGPTNLSPGGSGVLFLYVYNTGALLSSPGAKVINTLPPGLEAVSSLTLPTSTVEESPGCSGASVVTCELPEIAPGQRPDLIEIPVKVAGSASSASKPVDVVTVGGGGALSTARVEVPVVFSSSPAGLGFANVDGWVTGADGRVDTQAGSHPYEFTVAFAPNSAGVGSGNELPTGGEAHALTVNLPPGLVGEPSAVPQCTRQQFDGLECPPSTIVGEDLASASGFGLFQFEVFNLVPPPGVAAQFGFSFNGTAIFLDAGVRSGGDSGIVAHVDPVAQQQVVFNTTTIWGVPGEHGTGAPLKPFLSLPTSCGAPPKFGVEIHGTWQEEAQTALVQGGFTWHDNADAPVGITGCERLVHFNPSMSIAPDTGRADTPAGLSATVRVPQGLNPEGLATSGLRNTTVVLPEGMVINPGQATGLAACQQGPGPGEDDLPLPGEDGENELFSGPPSCPAASKVGEDEIQTPLLPDRLRGNVYVLQSNPPELKLLVAASGDGVNIKLVGTVHLNEATGQITTTFENTPDAPINEFKLSFSGGAQAALVTPPTCRVYTTSTDFTPWTGLQDQLVEGNFTIDSGPGGSPCANPLPFSPVLTAGSTTDQAGGYTNFSLLLQRGDGQQRVSGLQFKTPAGLLGMISKVALCGEPQASKGQCSSASQIGHTVVGAGPGPYPLFIPQAGQPPAAIYLTGPYEGAPYGLSIVVPIVAGPFTLETQVVRARIEVDPHTSQLLITTDPLPRIIDGVPADLRSINAVVDRPGFMFNPTNCNPASFTGTAVSTEGVSAQVSSPFQVGSCQALKFKPNFKVSSEGKTSRLNGASLTAKIVYPTVALGDNQATSQANIARVKVELPKRLPSRLSTLQKACRAAVFQANPAGCPEGSVVGHATAVTPVLPAPLSGPAYFVSHGGEAFPSLIVVLQGQNITIDLEGTTFISKKGITTSTFKAVPDVPVASFELVLPKGPHSALAANGNLCNGALSMPTEFLGQNGALINQTTKINVTGCPKHKKAKKAKHKSKKKGSKKKK